MFDKYGTGLMLSGSEIDQIGKVLIDSRQPLCARFRALFVLRNIGCDRSVQWIAQCFCDKSALLKHELAYCLGQMQNKCALPVLESVLEDKNQENIVRHEAGEALGAIGSLSSISILEKYVDDKTQVIAETCKLALQRILWLQESNRHCKNVLKSPYNSIGTSLYLLLADPTPCSVETSVEKLTSALVDASKPLWERYQALFSLRNIGSVEAIKALSKGLTCSDSALLRHEVAYALGQVQSPVAFEELKFSLENLKENHMVRHECAEALGAIATEECKEVLKKFRNDSECIVRESCEVALDMADYESSSQFHANTIVLVDYSSFNSSSLKPVLLSPLLTNSYRKTKTDDPLVLTDEDIGCLYQVRNEDVQKLYDRFMLPVKFRKQIETLGECVWLYRKPTYEATTCLKLVSMNIPNIRLLLWGRWGTGKSMTFHQIIYHVWKQGWVIFAIPDAITLMRNYGEVMMSNYREGRIDFPKLGNQILHRFKMMNTLNWEKLKECKTQKHYKWSKVEETKTGEPITNIVDIKMTTTYNNISQGLSAPSLSSDCVGGLLRELTHHCSNGKFPLLVAVDSANSLFGKTTLKDKNHALVDPNQFTLVHAIRKLFKNDWTNGACLLVGDKKEISDARDHLTVPLDTPLELFGDHIEEIEPFIPIETSLYTTEEMDALYDYYVEKNWIVSKMGRTERARTELKFLSGGNPFNYERICAFI
ncbi:unnamed protein product [Thelazia callipaeda]|uniref:Deoxyhypusine hydroxylase n=1 Tax=Thelazia callipaeda TaxID=103827 RepID=A0A158RAT0_THECL|nr:unnamed protein product [Thelazia callipaeda]